MEVTSGWSFQQSHWLTALSQDVLDVSLEQRQQRYKILQALGLIEAPNPSFILTLLLNCRTEHVLFWTSEALQAIASVLKDA